MEKMFCLVGSTASDYWEGGVTIVHGASFLDENNNRKLYRAGPAVPMFSAPSYSPLLATQMGKELLIKDGFRGLSFKEIDYANVVDIDWHTWELDEEVPDDQYTSDFGSLIMDQTKHRDDLLSQMPKIFEVITELTLDVNFTPSPRVNLANYNGQRLVNCVDPSKNIVFPLISIEGTKWFLKKGEGLLSFHEVNRPAETVLWTPEMFFSDTDKKGKKGDAAH